MSDGQVSTLPPLRTAKIGGRVQAWREAGAEDGAPVLVLLHGIGGGSEGWRHQYRAFADRFRVIGWDMPGYGGSEGFDDAAPPVGLYADALAALLDELGVGKAHVLGQSVAALIAARSSAFWPMPVITPRSRRPVNSIGRCLIF